MLFGWRGDGDGDRDLNTGPGRVGRRRWTSSTSPRPDDVVALDLTRTHFMGPIAIGAGDQSLVAVGAVRLRGTTLDDDMDAMSVRKTREQGERKVDNHEYGFFCLRIRRIYYRKSANEAGKPTASTIVMR